VEALQAALEAYCQRLRDLYLMAKADRLGELRGRRSRLLDDQGLHPWSIVWGEAMGLAVLFPEIPAAIPPDPVGIRGAAYTDAEDEFAAEVAEYGGQAFRRRG